MKKAIGIILSLIMIMNITACGAQNEKKRYEAEFLLLFDTVTRIVAYTESKDEFTKYAELIHDKLEEYHQLYDIYHDYEGINNVKTINDHAGISPVKVDRKIIDLLLFSKEAYELTGGKVNVAFGSVLKIWHDYRTEGIEDPEKAKLPSSEELQEAAKHTDIHNMIIDEKASTVYLSDPDMRLDVGAVAKGYATEQVSEYAMEQGFRSGLLSVGGNVRAIGTKGDSDALWNVGIQNPDKESKQSNLYVANITDLSLVTSGTYERYYSVNGVNYHHIIDPETLFPAQYFTAVTIVTHDSGLADALSTAIFNMPVEKGKKLIESMPDTEALWIFQDGTTAMSTGFPEFIKE
jgi:thiamine biosynthesis lipoprotein